MVEGLGAAWGRVGGTDAARVLRAVVERRLEGGGLNDEGLGLDDLAATWRGIRRMGGIGEGGVRAVKEATEKLGGWEV